MDKHLTLELEAAMSKNSTLRLKLDEAKREIAKQKELHIPMMQDLRAYRDAMAMKEMEILDLKAKIMRLQETNEHFRSEKDKKAEQVINDWAGDLLYEVDTWPN